MSPTARAGGSRSGSAGRCPGRAARTCSCAQSPLPAIGHGNALAPRVVVADEDALRFRDDAPVGLQFVLQLEALRPDPHEAHADVDHLSDAYLSAEVDLRPGEDDVAQRHLFVLAEPGQAGLLEVRREDRVVHVAHAVEITKTHRLAVHERIPLHPFDGIDALWPER